MKITKRISALMIVLVLVFSLIPYITISAAIEINECNYIKKMIGLTLNWNMIK